MQRPRTTPMAMDLPETAPEDESVEVLLAGSDPEYLQQVADKVYQDDINVHTVATTDPESAISRIESGGVDCLIATYNPSANEGLPILDFLRETAMEVPVILLPSGPTTVVVSENLVVDVASVFTRDEALNGNFGPDVVVDAVKESRATAAAKRRRGLADAIRSVAREMSDAESRDDLDRSLVDGMAGSDEIDQAWMAKVDDEDVAFTAEAGEADSPAPDADDPTGQAVKRALAVEQPQVTTQEGTSYAAVPIVPEHDESGVLTMASRDRFAFGDDETQVLGDVGDTARRAIDQVVEAAGEPESIQGQRALDTVVERLSVPVVVYGPAGWVVGVNEAFAEMVGREHFELMGDPVWEVLPAPRLETFEDYWASFGPGETRTQLVEFASLTDPRQMVTTRVSMGDAEYNVSLAVDPVEQGADPWFADVLAYEFRHWLAIAEEAVDDREPGEESAVLDEVVDRMQDAITSEVSAARAGAEAGMSPQEALDDVPGVDQAAPTDPAAEAAKAKASDILGDADGAADAAGTAADGAEAGGGAAAGDIDVDRPGEGVGAADDGLSPEEVASAERASDDGPIPERGAASMEPHTVGEVAQQAWTTVVGDFGDYEITGGRRVYADRTMLSRLFAHLFRTLFAYGKASAVDVGTTEDGFFVQDDGSGVPHVDRDYAEAATMTDARSGASIRVARRLAERHGWELSVMPNDRGGSRFEVTGVVQASDD